MNLAMNAKVANDTNNKENDATKEAKRHMGACIQQRMDAHIHASLEQLHQLSRIRCAKSMCRCIARSIERGIADATNPAQAEWKSASGHGKPNLKHIEVTTNWEKHVQYSQPDAALQSLLDNAMGVGEEAKRCGLQARRPQKFATDSDDV